ncbi:MAG: hypothetical protein NUV65_03940 [Candidatus Roizmanbacteria bacterium]|nr:hypothetical protein [Candidatus Roizmanbacteria bacterium]
MKMPDVVQQAWQVFDGNEKFALVVIAALNVAGRYAQDVLDRAASTPLPLQGHLSDTALAGQVYMLTEVAGIKSLAIRTAVTLGLAYGAEIGQGLHLVDGGYNSGDFVAYTIGVLGLMGIEQGVKKIHRLRNKSSIST